ncbi:binding-protein-dependent transport systems inner membrane component [Maridesulfovibrio salexigens DSM 2638]|uniref:Binding-protein-dependent transport systems inner membrane component n=1 Tax=Maridesulfovibrio salexigens (strain ATCC 14822 / DSM 2638 / NCIMB 8403 / VKM B-1763) TaxID=526222 RepID=C6BXL0_MARSD|nr:carbohydrate ABC transporter permease [Maridesulfovibrio salexigens]ACS78568.1 binding-protein-dependent transport systems inner membrane component [Maridesulfovibrio salexigens DSM 2638]
MSTTTRKSGITPGSILLYGSLFMLALLFLMPAYMAIVTALKDPANISLPTAWELPEKFNWQSFPEAFGLLKSNIASSLVLTVCATALSTVLGSLNGYVFSKWKFKGSELIFTLFLFGMFIPYQVILIPLFQTLRAMNLYGGLPGLILAHVVYGLPITSLIFRNFYAQIPTALVESARLDGAGFFSIYTKIVFPLSIPGFVVTSLWQVTQIWNEFLWGICLTRHEDNPITVGLAQLAGGQAVSWNLPMAGSIMAAFPVLMIYIFLGRYFIRGLLAGSVKE